MYIQHDRAAAAEQQRSQEREQTKTLEGGVGKEENGRESKEERWVLDTFSPLSARENPTEPKRQNLPQSLTKLLANQQLTRLSFLVAVGCKCYASVFLSVSV